MVINPLKLTNKQSVFSLLDLVCIILYGTPQPFVSITDEHFPSLPWYSFPKTGSDPSYLAFFQEPEETEEDAAANDTMSPSKSKRKRSTRKSKEPKSEPAPSAPLVTVGPEYYNPLNLVEEACLTHTPEDFYLILGRQSWKDQLKKENITSPS